MKHNQIYLGGLSAICDEYYRTDNVPSHYRLLFKTLDNIRKSTDIKYSPEDPYYSDTVNSDRIIVLSNIYHRVHDTDSCTILAHELYGIVSFLEKQNPDSIIVAELDFSKLDEYSMDEEYVSIPDEITKAHYQISNYGNILDDNGKIVKPVYFDDGPRVFLPSHDGVVTGYYHSIPLIMVTVFKPIDKANENTKMIPETIRISSIQRSLEYAKFTSVDGYYNGSIIPYIYTDNGIGGAIAHQLIGVLKK